MKAYILGPENNGDGVYYLVTEQGECLASHLCTHIGFAKSDLILGRPKRIEEWNKRFGKIELRDLKKDKLTVEELQKRNKELKEEDLVINKEHQHSIKITTEEDRT